MIISLNPTHTSIRIDLHILKYTFNVLLYEGHIICLLLQILTSCTLVLRRPLTPLLAPHPSPSMTEHGISLLRFYSISLLKLTKLSSKFSFLFLWQPQNVQQENKTPFLPFWYDIFIQLLGLWWQTSQNVSLLFLSHIDKIRFFRVIFLSYQDFYVFRYHHTGPVSGFFALRESLAILAERVKLKSRSHWKIMFSVVNVWKYIGRIGICLPAHGLSS